MDKTVQEEIGRLVAELKKAGHNVDDPVAKLIVTALVHQAQKIKDEIDNIPGKVTDRLCEYFIPRDKVSAMPAICLVKPVLKAKKGVVPHNVGSGLVLNYKLGPKQFLSYCPLFSNLLIPYGKRHLVTPRIFKSGTNSSTVKSDKKGLVWLGMEIDTEVDTLNNVSFLINGTGGVLPERIYAGNGTVEINYSQASQMENIPMLEPFDAQQSSHLFFDVIRSWKDALSNMDNEQLIYVTDKLNDRDAFKCRAYPKVLQQSLESSDLDKFASNTLWVLFDFGRNYDVPDDIDIIPNVTPVVNVSVNNVMLTSSSPMAKLTKGDGSNFLSVVETSTASYRQGFEAVGNEVVIRDFDAHAYDCELLYREVRTLYNRFVDDYYAFVNYYGLKDGEMVRTLRETVNRIGKSVLSRPDGAPRYDEGVYAIRNVNATNQASSIKVLYLTTFGRIGNTPQPGDMMENKKDAAIEKDVAVVVAGMGGVDRADADQKYELLRYYTLTADRLYTKMDIDAFLRLQLLKEFGKEEIKRIKYSMTVQGAGSGEMLRRGLYIDISFKDNKNFKKAESLALDRKLQRQIAAKSCISMPIIVGLVNLENNE